MSDLISTPSQTQSTVSNDAFDALVDLLTFDGIDENLTGDHIRPQANVSLRDASGKLDYDKIRVMFASKHAQKPPREERKRAQTVQTPILPDDEGDSDDELHSHKSSPSTVPSRLHSMSPKPVAHTITGHRRSSTFGNEPWTPIHGNVTGAKVEDVPPMLLPQPLSFDELNTALAGAQEEVKSLRQQYDELQALVSKRFGAAAPGCTELRVASDVVNTDKPTPGNSGGCIETRDTGSQVQLSAVPVSPLPSDVPTEIANLSENEAKSALNALARSLNLSPNAIVAMANASTSAESTSPKQSLSPPSLNRQHDVVSIVRAVKFLGTVDELVWRRSSMASGPRTLLPVFSEENVIALKARLELWERAVRRSSRH